MTRGRRLPPIIGALLVGGVATAALGRFDPATLGALELAQPVVQMPQWSWAAMVELVVPLAITVLVVQNGQGVAVLKSAGHEPPVDDRMSQRIVAMGKQARIQIVQAKRAFIDRDVEMARNLVVLDDEIDRQNRECFALAIEIGDDLDRREWAMTMLLAARALERIGDNTVDVGEQVAFIVTGLFREFEDASHPDIV